MIIVVVNSSKIKYIWGMFSVNNVKIKNKIYKGITLEVFWNIITLLVVRIIARIVKSDRHFLLCILLYAIQCHLEFLFLMMSL